MSRRKAGCIPRRVELEPIAAGSDNDDDMELVIEVDPEPDARAPQAQGPRWKEVAAPPGCSDREPRFCLDASVHALSSRPKCWAALMEDRPAGECNARVQECTPGAPPSLHPFTLPSVPGLSKSGGPPTFSSPQPSPPPASSLQTARPAPRNTPIC